MAESGISCVANRCPPSPRLTIDRRGGRPAFSRAAPAAARVARAAGQRPPVPRHLAARRPAAAAARVQRGAARAAAAAEPAAGVRPGRRRPARARSLPQWPNRVPGTAGATGAAEWFREQLAPYGFIVRVRAVHGDGPRSRQRPFTNLVAVKPGALAADDRGDGAPRRLGIGPGANDNASGTAALIELARAYAPQAGAARLQLPYSLLFLSTDGGTDGGDRRGAVRGAFAGGAERRGGAEPRRGRGTRSRGSSSPATRRARRSRDSSRPPGRC